MTAILAALAAPCLPCGSALAAKGAGEAIGYLKTRQSADGGFAEPDASPDVPTTCWAMIAGASAGENVLQWKSGTAGPLEFLEASAESIQKLEDVETCALALAEAGADPKDLAGKDLVAIIKAHQRDDGRIGDNAYETCWGLIALVAAGEDAPSKTIEWLNKSQRADGGWGESDRVVVTDTSLAVEALAGAGESDDAAIEKAMKLLREKMASDGGFAAEGGSSNTELTSQVLGAIYASGQDPSSEGWTFHGNNPRAFLDSMQEADGHFLYSKGTESQPTMMTAIAVPPTGGKSLPLGASSARSDPSSAVHDLGTTGAGMAAGTVPAVPASSDEQGAEAMSSSAEARPLASTSGLWVFVILCVAYALVLAVAAIAAAWLYVPKERYGPSSAHGPGAPPGGSGP